MLDVRLLGKFEVRQDGQAVEIPSRPAQSLLAYLVLNAGTPYRREKLAGLLWPDSDESTARSNLRQTLWRLRKAVGDTYFLTDRVTIGFDADAAYTLDVETLAQSAAATDELIDAVSVYGGDLLPGFYDDWVVLERERLHATVEDRLQQLLDRLAEAGRWRELRQWAERWLALGHVPEPAFRALMTAHAAQGDVGGVAAVFERCVALLDEELGVGPSAETQALYDRLIKGGKPPQAAGQPAPVTAPSPSQPAFLDEANQPAASPHEIFIGRDRALARLDRVLANSLAGQGQVLFVVGEAGQGKTSLLRAFARRAQAAQPALIVASGTCDVYTGVGDPYLPFRGILSMLAGEVEGLWSAGAITRDHARRLWELRPQTIQALVEVGPDLIGAFIAGAPLLNSAEAPWADRLRALLASRDTPNGDQGPDQSHIFEEYAAVLAALAARHPLLLLLDDLHWADLSSISLLSHLAHRLEEQPVLILGAYRPEDVSQGRDGERHPLADILSELKRRFGNIRLDLAHDEETESRAFVDGLLDAELNRFGENFRQQLVQHTGGHPLFTVELLRNMRERGDLRQDRHGHWFEAPHLAWNILPTRVEGVVEMRIGRLNASLQELLAVASVEGEEFTVQVIAPVLKVDERQLVQQLSVALDRQHRLVAAQGIRRLEPGGQRLSRYRFRHNLFRTYLYRNLDEVERAYLHEAVGRALEELYGPQAADIAAQLAHHFEQAGLIPRAIEYWQQAGDVAARVYANAEAVAAYQRALALTSPAETDAETLSYLYTRIGRALELNTEFDQALATYEALQQLARQRQEQTMELAALMAQVNLHATPTPLFDPAEGQHLGEQALALALEMGNQAAEAKIMWNLLNVSMYSNRLSQAITYGERALVLARQLNLRNQEAYSLNDLAQSYWVTGQFDRAKVMLRQAGELWRELDNLPMLADSVSTLCSVHVHAGEYDQAIKCSEEAFDISQSIGNSWGQAYSQFQVGLAYWERGQPGQAIAVMEEAIGISEQSGFVSPQAFTRSRLAALYGELGAVKRGLAAANRALTIAETQIPPYRASILGILALLYLLDGDLDEAESALNRGKQDPNREAWPVYYVMVHAADIELALAQENFDQAEALASALLENLRRFGMASELPGALYQQGLARLGLKQAEAARASFIEARAAAEAIGSRRVGWQILGTLSQLEPDPAEARQLRQQAREMVQYIAGHTPAPEPRGSFLTLPRVQALLATDAD